jgi:hypothetical protein
MEEFRVMNRGIAATVVSLAVMSIFGTARAKGDSDASIATTARIIRINSKAKTMVVRSSEGSAVRSGPAIEMPGVMLPGRISITLPERAGAEFTVVTTGDTTFQDGADALQFEDFKRGETISIHGVRSGRVVTASRVAKWG